LGVRDDGEAAFAVTSAYQHGVALIDQHANDSRYKLCKDGIAPTLNARINIPKKTCQKMGSSIK
jgi:hypothetical protein